MGGAQLLALQVFDFRTRIRSCAPDGATIRRLAWGFCGAALASLDGWKAKTMSIEPKSNRTEILRTILCRERNKAFAQVREYRRDQDDEATAPPVDELDAARTLAEVETHASLIEQVENRIKQIDTAFFRLEQGSYGVCAECGDVIPLERLEALPFATRCIDCQKGRERTRRGEGGMNEPFGRQWEVPIEVDESTEASRDEMARLPEEELIIHREKPLGPEEGQLEKPPRIAPGRRRSR